MPQIVVGTAGHIDHGKTSLVKSLTGTDTDSLIEEKSRGLTIDLGFAYLNSEIAIIDVPGHEKFIRNMVAGASNIHIGLIVVASDDGVMPQTREHLDILKLLGVSKGLVILTKIDKVKDEDWLELVEMDIQDLLDSVGFKSISTRRVNNLTGDGIDAVRDDILLLAKDYSFKINANSFRLYVDRVFSKVGFGTVVTGTVQSGNLTVGEELEIFPNKIKTKVRGLQSHGGSIKSISIGQRAALNLTNVNKSEIKRGAVLSTVDSLNLTKKIICRITLVNSTKWIIRSKQRLRFHLGTGEFFGRIIPCNYSNMSKGISDNAIIEFETDVTVLMNDKILIRSYSPMETIAGGIVINTHPIGNNSKMRLNGGKIPLDIKKRFYYFVTLNWRYPKSIINWGNYLFLDIKTIEKWVKSNDFQKTNDGLIYSKLNLKKTQDKISLFFKKQYESNPYRAVLNTESIVSSLKINNEWFGYVMNKLIDNNLFIYHKGGFSVIDYEFEPTRLDQNDLQKLRQVFIKSGLTPIAYKQILSNIKIKPNRLSDLLYILEHKDDIKNIGNNIYISIKSLNTILNKVKLFYKNEETMSVAQFKKITDLSRKGAIPLLEFLDKNLFTIRSENDRIPGQTLNG